MANCVCTLYTSALAAETGIETIDDTKFLGMAVVDDPKMGKVIMVVKKT